MVSKKRIWTRTPPSSRRKTSWKGRRKTKTKSFQGRNSERNHPKSSQGHESAAEHIRARQQHKLDTGCQRKFGESLIDVVEWCTVPIGTGQRIDVALMVAPSCRDEEPERAAQIDHRSVCVLSSDNSVGYEANAMCLCFCSFCYRPLLCYPLCLSHFDDNQFGHALFLTLMPST